MKYTRRTILKHRKMWLAALRDGTREQTHGVLRRRGGGYCCLGVACEVAKLPSTEIPYGVDADVLVFQYGKDTGSYGSTSYELLPPQGQDWLGLSSQNPQVNFPHGNDETGEGFWFQGHEVSGPTELAELNDVGWTFEQIADAIEEFGFTADDDELQQAE